MQKRKTKYPMPTKWQSFRLRHRYLFDLRGTVPLVTFAVDIAAYYVLVVACLSLLNITQAYPFTTPISFADLGWLSAGFFAVVLTMLRVNVRFGKKSIVRGIVRAELRRGEDEVDSRYEVKNMDDDFWMQTTSGVEHQEFDINPANGLPMVGPYDISGNLYGFSSQSD
jgi:hypothetical protein